MLYLNVVFSGLKISNSYFYFSEIVSQINDREKERKQLSSLYNISIRHFASKRGRRFQKTMEEKSLGFSWGKGQRQIQDNM